MKMLTPQEVEDRLAQEGVTPGQWHQAGGVVLQPAVVTQQVVALTKLRDALQHDANQQQSRLVHLREMLARLKNGGGR